MTCETLLKLVNQEAEKEYRYQRDRYEFAMAHLWLPKFELTSTPARYAFGKELTYGP